MGGHTGWTGMIPSLESGSKGPAWFLRYADSTAAETTTQHQNIQLVKRI